MPVKWTSDYDQLLLLKILETHEVSVDARKISEAWPCDRGEIPTARAIQERLIKIRQIARQTGSGNFNIASAQSKRTAKAPTETTRIASTRVHKPGSRPKTGTKARDLDGSNFQAPRIKKEIVESAVPSIQPGEEPDRRSRYMNSPHDEERGSTSRTRKQGRQYLKTEDRDDAFNARSDLDPSDGYSDSYEI